MKTLKKIRLNELTNQVSKVEVDKMKKITGGTNMEMEDGCYSGICSQKINTTYCEGGAVCTSGIAG